ncbi:winged helix-turn-helix domain-containing protein [Streptomyces sp. NPDC052036]|uniref:winged helix-turn-helix domain-containing protein n=1 Tax=Streptomyces sp. NPDC052036 TaxID=3155171 RepID=UPI00344240CB
MIDVSLTASSLPQSRFTVSPVMQAVVLHPQRAGRSGRGQAVRHELRALLADGRLPLVSALRQAIRGYAPGCLTPALATDGALNLNVGLHHIARTPGTSAASTSSTPPQSPRADSAHAAVEHAEPPNRGEHPLAQVIGHTRFALLESLGSSRTPGELAERDHLSPSTVSYRLVHLHRAGLVTRFQLAKHVYYQRTLGSEQLLHQGVRTPLSPRGGVASCRGHAGAATEYTAGIVSN